VGECKERKKMNQKNMNMFLQNYSRKKLLFVAAIFIVSAFIWISAKRTLINSESYKVALEFIKTDPQINLEFGQIIKVGFPGGSIDQAQGKAVFNVRVEGNLRNERVQLNLKKTEFGVWFVEDWKIK